MYEEPAMYIGGEWRQGSDGAGEDVINPATEETLAPPGEVARADAGVARVEPHPAGAHHAADRRDAAR